MTIISMTATFGGLQNATLTLRDGLNILELPNEGGKSTWCAFLKAIFYGLESRKGRENSERNRHTPWSGAPMRGVVELTWQGREITLRRFPKGADPFGGFQAVYTGTEEPVPGLTAANVGETILGCTKEVFERTCFISQGGLPVEKSGDLERRVAALAAGGEEDVSFSDTQRRLKDWRNSRQANRSTGSIPRLKAGLEELEDRRRQLLEAKEQVTEAEGRLARLREEKREVAADLGRHEALQAEDRRERYQQAGAELEAAQSRYQQALEEPGPVLPPASKLSPALLWILFALALVLPALLGLLGGSWPAAGLGTGVLLAALVWLLLIRPAGRNAALRSRGEAALRDRELRLSGLKGDLEAARQVWEALSAQGEPPLPPDSRPPLWDYDEDLSRLRELDRAIPLWEERRAQATGRIQAIGDPAQLDARRDTLLERLAKEEGELAALDMALEALTAANAKLQSRFSPAVNALAGELMSRLTGGRYTAFSFTRDFQALVDPGDGLRPAQALSGGTADQAYLALRLAVSALALSGREPGPLVLDDALVNFDDGRAALALGLLRELGEERQVLLFTCHSRERKLV